MLLCLLGLVVKAQNTSLPVGVVPGNADVSDMGAATYNIPIEVVPGTKGVQPNLNVVYNSTGGAGLLGCQWDLAGLSSIARTGQNTFLDLRSSSVSLDYTDRFALDGNRLVCNDPTQYGYSGTLYQPEFENFSKTYSYGTTGNGPDFFKVFRDDGSVAEYGNSVDSKQKLGNTVCRWLVNKVTDLNGNYMTFSYGRNGNEVWIDHIDYTGNEEAGLSPYARVSFAYDVCTHIASEFVAGHEIRQTRLLRAITVQYKNGSAYETVRQYRFDYAEGFPKKLTGVRLAGADGTELNPTVVEWSSITYNDHVNATLLPINNLESEKKHTAVDFNKDGNCDVFVYGGRSIYYYVNQNGNFVYSNYHYDAGTSYYVRKCVPADMDGDGFSEIITSFTDYQKHMTYVTRTCLPFQTDTLFPVIQTNGYKDIVTGDFLGNGQNQVVLLYRGPSSYCIQTSFQGSPQTVSGGYADVIDFDGDGQMELLVLDETTLTNFTVYKYDVASGVFFVLHQGAFNSAFRASGDFNGDGISDVLIGQSTSFRILLGTGKGFVTKPANQSFGLHNTLSSYRISPVVVDINNDGFDDVLAFNKVTDGLKVICYVGSGFFDDTLHFKNNISPSMLPVFLSLADLPKHDFTFGDFNNDRHLDLISFKTIDPTHDGLLVYEFNMDKRSPQVRKVTVSDGSYTSWQYHDIHGLYYRYASHVSILPFGVNVVESMTNTLGTSTQTNTIRYTFQQPAFSFKRHQRMGFLRSALTDVNLQTTDSVYSQIIKNDYGLPQDILMPLSRKTYVSGQLTKATGYQTLCPMFSNGKRCLPYIFKNADTNLLDMSVITNRTLRWPHTGRLQAVSTETKTAGDFYPLTTERTEYRQSTHTLPSGAHVTLTDSTITEIWMNNNNALKSVQRQFFQYNNRSLPEQITVIMDGVSTTQQILNYDYFGNGTIITYSCDSCLDRNIAINYDHTGRFCEYRSLGSSFSHSYTYSPTTGLLVSQMDENNLATSYSYDAFGRLTAIHYPDGNRDTIRYKWYTGTEVPFAKYYTLASTPGQDYDTERYYDLMGRNVCTRYNGSYSDTCYDLKGSVYRISAPYMRGTSDASKVWHNFQYDLYGRVIHETGPYSDMTYQYSGYTTTITDNLRNTSTTRTVDAAGRVLSATDAGGTITFAYSHVPYNGHTATQTSITACGNISRVLTDAKGNRLQITDPDAGVVTCRYNGFNQVTQQSDARGNLTRFQYDQWGRLSQKQFTTPANESETWTYEYDHYTSSNRGRLKLYRIKKNGALSEEHLYDTLSRPASRTRHIDGIAYTESYAYNAYGQLSTLTYPDGFATDFSYTGKGHINEITRHDDGRRIFKAYNYNVFGQPTRCGYGNNTATDYQYNAAGLLTRINSGNKNYAPVNPGRPPIIDFEPLSGIGSAGINSVTLNPPDESPFTVDSTVQNFRYQYDAMGRLVQRVQKNSQYETFQYDNLDRLTSFAQGTLSGTSQTLTTTYDGQGNILSNTLVGTYSYGSDKPHAVTEVTPNDTFPDAISAANCITEYNAFNQPSRIEEGDEEILLEYGADGQRVKAVFKYHGHLVRTRYYISSNYEKEVEAGGVTTHYNYVYGVNGLAAICVRRNGIDSMYYVHPDRLGSYTHITNSGKQVVRALHFDPWGNVKTDADWTVFAEGEPGHLAETFRFDRGFTGHEHYADMKIINMNGRLYDPVIARFFSPDNFVQAPEFTQSYNRYSYCLNNPLQWVDPSGEDILDPWYRDAIGIVRWTDSEFKMPKGGFFLGSEGVFTSDGEMRYYYADGRISNLKLPQVFIDWGNPVDFTFYSSPLKGAGFYRIGDPSEQMGSFSSNFQYVAPINPGYINGLNGIATTMGTQYHLIEYAARSKYKSARTWREFKNLSKSKKTWRYNHSIGQSGKILKGMAKWTGNGTAVVSMIGESVNYYNYTTTYGFDWKVTAKYGLDMIMTGVGFFGPVGFTVSSMYFILDVSTGGFGGFGEMR